MGARRLSIWCLVLAGLTTQHAFSQSWPYFPPPGYNCSAGPPAQIPFAAASNALNCSSLLAWTNSSATLTLGSTTTPGTVQPAAAAATANGAALTINAGAGGATSGNGAALNLNGGPASTTAVATAGNGGAVNLSGGNAIIGSGAATGNGGNVVIKAGLGAQSTGSQSTGDGGSVTITGGSAGATGGANAGNGNGGNVTITGGSAFGALSAKVSGNVTITGGGALSVGTDTPGNVIITSGATSTVGETQLGNGLAQVDFPAGGGRGWTLGTTSGTSNKLTGTSNGGVQLGSPTGADCGSACLNVQTDIRIANVSVKPLSGTTGSIGGGALVAGQCTSGTVSVTNSTTSMSVIATPATYPGDGAEWEGYVSSAGTVTVKVCAIVALTPTASTYNVRVLQ